MPHIKTTAIVLRSLKWGDADRIVTLYSKDRGKIRGVARGARRPKSRFGAALEPFSLSRLNLFEKTGDSLFRISQVDLVRSSLKLRGALRLIDSAARMVNVVAAITPDGDPDPLLFDTLEQGLASLHESEDPAFTALLFQIRLLGVTGFRPQTDHCATCGKAHFVGDPQFSPVAGGLVCLSCAAHQRVRCVALSRGSLSFLQQAIRLHPTVVTRLRACGQVRDEVEAAIEGYVTVVAGRRLPAVNFLSFTVSS